MDDSFLGLIVQEPDVISVTVGPTVVTGVHMIGAIPLHSLAGITSTYHVCMMRNAMGVRVVPGVVGFCKFKPAKIVVPLPVTNHKCDISRSLHLVVSIQFSTFIYSK